MGRRKKKGKKTYQGKKKAVKQKKEYSKNDKEAKEDVIYFWKNREAGRLYGRKIFT